MYSEKNNLETYIYQLHQYIKAQTDRIIVLEDSFKRLQKELNELKNKRTVNVEKIEYKFDQLKVETLEGTLNIGITPNGTEAIEDFAVNQENLQVSNQTSASTEASIIENLLGKIQTDVFDYFEKGIFKDFEKIEQESNYSLDQPYREFIIDDLKKQMNQRINFYLNQLDKEKLTSDKDIITESVMSHLKKDIYQAIEMFISNLPRKE